MSSPGLRPYNGSVVRKKAPKVGKQGGFMRLCTYCGLILKERDALAAAALGFIQGLVRAVEPVGGRRHPRAGSCPALIAMAGRPVRIMVVSSFSTGLLIVFTERRAAQAQMPSEPAIIKKISAYSVLKIIPRIVRAVTLPSGRQVV